MPFAPRGGSGVAYLAKAVRPHLRGRVHRSLGEGLDAGAASRRHLPVIRTSVAMTKDEKIKLLAAAFVEGAGWSEQYRAWNAEASSLELERAAKARAQQYAEEVA